jgi:hypothetical protein
MKYQIGPAGWPIGERLIKAGTIIDTSMIEWANLRWVPPPMDAIALDQATYDYMTGRLGYPISKVQAGPGVISKPLSSADER